MLTAIEIENFKAFGERTRIELAPITLIFGENSGGKSSILHVLSLLKQTRDSGEHGAVLLPRVNGGIVDLGSCRDMLFDHDPNRKLTIRLDMKTDGESEGDANRFLGGDGLAQSVGLEITVRRQAAAEALELESLSVFVNDQKAAVFEPIEPSKESNGAEAGESPLDSSKPEADRSSGPPRVYCTSLGERIHARNRRVAEKLAALVSSSLRNLDLVETSSHSRSNKALLEWIECNKKLNKRKELEPQIDPEQRPEFRRMQAICNALLLFRNKLPYIPDTFLPPPDRPLAFGEWPPNTSALPEPMDRQAVIDFYESGQGCDFLLAHECDYNELWVELDGFCPVPDKERFEDPEYGPEDTFAGFWKIERSLRWLEGAYQELQRLLAGVESKDWLLEESENRDSAEQEELLKLALEDWLPEEVVKLKSQSPPSEDWPSWDNSWISFLLLSLALQAGKLLASAIDAVYPMGPYRLPPERWHIFAGTRPRDVGYRGQFLPDLLLRQPDLVQQTNQWLDRLGIGYHIKTRPLDPESQDLFELRLVDTKRGVNVGMSDVGFGISQLLPFVVQCLASKEQIITIEQPEVHVPPRLQADIGDLLIDAIQEPRKHQFIVETHSEHLILRLLRRIRETHRGCLPDGHPGLRPEDLSVIYVKRTESGSQAHRIDIDANGEFVQPWPDDFFELDFQERFS